MKKFFTSTSEQGGEDSYEIIECKILRILSEDDALALRALRNVSVSIVIVIPRMVGNTVELLTITERNNKDVNVSRKMKLPSGGAMPGEHPFAAAKREARAETGYEIDDLIFACAAEYSTTIQGETHYKVFIVAKQHEQVSEPVYDGTDEILSVDWRPFDMTIRMIPDGQKTGMQPVIDKISMFSKEHYYAVGNTMSLIRFMEGPYSTYRRKKRF